MNPPEPAVMAGLYSSLQGKISAAGVYIWILACSCLGMTSAAALFFFLAGVFLAF